MAHNQRNLFAPLTSRQCASAFIANFLPVFCFLYEFTRYWNKLWKPTSCSFPDVLSKNGTRRNISLTVDGFVSCYRGRHIHNTHLNFSPLWLECLNSNLYFTWNNKNIIINDIPYPTFLFQIVLFSFYYVQDNLRFVVILNRRKISA